MCVCVNSVFFPVATPPCRKNQQYDCKWYVPLSELRLQAPEEAEPLAVPQVADEELDAIKLKISHLRSEIQREKVSRSRYGWEGLLLVPRWWLLGPKVQLCFLQRANKSCKATERLRKKLQEQQSLLLLSSPTIPLRMHSRSSGKVSSNSSSRSIFALPTRLVEIS